MTHALIGFIRQSRSFAHCRFSNQGHPSCRWCGLRVRLVELTLQPAFSQPLAAAPRWGLARSLSRYPARPPAMLTIGGPHFARSRPGSFDPAPAPALPARAGAAFWAPRRGVARAALPPFFGPPAHHPLPPLHFPSGEAFCTLLTPAAPPLLCGVWAWRPPSTVPRPTPAPIPPLSCPILPAHPLWPCFHSKPNWCAPPLPAVLPRLRRGAPPSPTH